MIAMSDIVVGANAERSRSHNRQVVLGRVRSAGRVGRAEIARASGLSTQAVSNIIAEEISAVCAMLDVTRGVTSVYFAPPVYKFGNDEQKERFLAPLASGELLGCFALTEPDAGSDPAALRTSARRDGDDYVIDGNKVFITNGTDADLALVFATVDPERKHRGITTFLVPADTPGYSRGGHEYKLGVNASGTTELAFEDLRIPARYRLGEEGEGTGVPWGTRDARHAIAGLSHTSRSRCR